MKIFINNLNARVFMIFTVTLHVSIKFYGPLGALKGQQLYNYVNKKYLQYTQKQDGKSCKIEKRHKHVHIHSCIVSLFVSIYCNIFI